AAASGPFPVTRPHIPSIPISADGISVPVDTEYQTQTGVAPNKIAANSAWPRVCSNSRASWKSAATANANNNLAKQNATVSLQPTIRNAKHKSTGQPTGYLL